MQIPIISGIFTDETPDFRQSYPRNMMPIALEQGISTGYLRPCDGIRLFATSVGQDRGGINWNGVMYRVRGTKLVSVDADGVVTEIGDVGDGNQVTLDYSFDYLSITSGGNLFYYDGMTLQQVTDPDLGTALDHVWVDGYFMTTDGEFLIVTDLADPFSINPLKYGSAEADPDPVVALIKLRNEVYALNRHTIEVFDNIGGSGFPFQRIESAQVPKGCVGTQACAVLSDAIAFMGGGRNEAISIYVVGSGQAVKISTREIDEILEGFTEDELAFTVMETRVGKSNELLYIHLADKSLVYDQATSQALGRPVWFTVDSGLGDASTYRARGFVRCYDKWIAGDPTSNNIGEMVDDISTHYGEKVSWDFGIQILYNEGNGAIIHELELVSLPGRVALGVDPTISTTYSLDGVTWSQIRYKSAGRQGNRNKRIMWRDQGSMDNWRIQKFSGNSDAHIAIARLEAKIEPLLTRV